MPPTHMMLRRSVADRATTVLFLPCQHQHTFSDIDQADAQHSRREADEFVRIHSICWDCVFLQEAEDA